MIDPDARPPVNPRELAVTFCHGCENRGCIWIITNDDGGNNFCSECCWYKFGAWGKDKLMGFDDETLRRYARADCGWVPPSVMQAERDRRVRVAAEKVAAEALAAKQEWIRKVQAELDEAKRIRASCQNPRCTKGADGRQKLLISIAGHRPRKYCCDSCKVMAFTDAQKVGKVRRPAHRPRLPKRKARRKEARKRYRQWKRTQQEVADDQLFASYGGIAEAGRLIECSMPTEEAQILARALYRHGIVPVGYYWYVRGSEIPASPEPVKRRRQAPSASAADNFARMRVMFGGGSWTSDQWQEMKESKHIPLDKLESVEKQVREETERKQLENAELLYYQTHKSRPSWAKPVVDPQDKDDDGEPERVRWSRRR